MNPEHGREDTQASLDRQHRIGAAVGESAASAQALEPHEDDRRPLHDRTVDVDISHFRTTPVARAQTPVQAPATGFDTFASLVKRATGK